MDIFEMSRDDIRTIKIYKNGLLYNKHHDRCYVLKKYAKIEFFIQDKTLILDLIAGGNLTNRDYLEIIKEGTLTKTLFDNGIRKK